MTALQFHVDDKEQKSYKLEDATEKRLAALREWLIEHDTDLTESLIGKAVQYGSADFDIMGHSLAGLVPPDPDEAKDADAVRSYGIEMAIAFYVLGKVARAISAFQRGQLPTEDTIMDVEAYAKIWGKIRETGTWY